MKRKGKVVKNRKSWAGLVLAACCCMCMAASAVAQDAGSMMQENEVTLIKIKEVLGAAMIKSEFDQDGDLMIVSDLSVKVYFKLDTDKKLVSIFSLWPLKADVPVLKKHELLNTFNDELIFVRFCMPNETTLWCDYQFSYEGGVPAFSIVNNYRLFLRVVTGAVLLKDPEDIIGN
jgi:hypothetical protein